MASIAPAPIAVHPEVSTSPAPFPLSDLLAAGDRADALPLVPPCDCGDCASCDDRQAAALAEALGLDDDAPSESDRDFWAVESGTAWDLRKARLARSWAGGWRMGSAGCALSVPTFLKDEELAAAMTDGWVVGAAEMAEAMPTPSAVLDQAERMGWEGDDLTIPADLYDHQAAEFAAAWTAGRDQRHRDEEELAQERFGRGVVLA
jgi:hypothetical protein